MAPNFGTNIIGSGKCSNVSGLFEEPFIGVPKIVQFITQDCQAYFNNPTQQSKCKQMANNIYAVLVASPNKNMTHKMHLTADIVTVYIFNDPMPPLRKKFVQNATLGTWGTLEELLNCTKMATPSQTPSQSDCSDIKSLVTPLVQGANPPIVYYLKEGATPTYPSNCSQADRLFIPRNNSPLVKYLIEGKITCRTSNHPYFVLHELPSIKYLFKEQRFENVNMCGMVECYEIEYMNLSTNPIQNQTYPMIANYLATCLFSLCGRRCTHPHVTLC
ncbi:unnamed protein product [Anisakis simplex]|uniref:Peptidase S1 domain-containing protein n=1 Tax=Anisakis simplex TaxID=6269 RepID=A0A0M3J3H3_ANISI|nr:unnamed protein product [Anisakis simplex]